MPDFLPGDASIYEAEPAPFDFRALVAGTYRRARPTIGRREDNVALFYRGKEHTIYGETESGKDMLLLIAVRECLERERPLRVAWIDFEEGDGADTGMRLLNYGLDPSVLCNPHRFRYYTPADLIQAEADYADALEWKPGLCIFNGVTAAYSVYGWPMKDNDSATEFRKVLVRPMLGVRAATIATDHVTKEESTARGTGNGKRRAPRGRYALGGVMKLNVVNGAAYLLENVAPIVRGGEGASKIFLTKDRPGSVKPRCARTADPRVGYAGMMIVKSSGDGAGELAISVAAPVADETPNGGTDPGAEVPGWLMEKVSRIFEGRAGGLSKTAVKNGWKGDGARSVGLAIEMLESGGYLADGAGSTSGRKLVSVRPWREGIDDKPRIGTE